MFVGTQQRITLNNTHYYVDMVFYNKILRAYVLIELKTTKLTPEAAGQLNMYLNYYAAEVNDEHDNPPIGIILCTDKDSVAAEYALGGLSNNIFASRYVSYIPNKEQLIAQVEAVLDEWHKPEKNNKRILTLPPEGITTPLRRYRVSYFPNLAAFYRRHVKTVLSGSILLKLHHNAAHSTFQLHILEALLLICFSCARPL